MFAGTLSNQPSHNPPPPLYQNLAFLAPAQHLSGMKFLAQLSPQGARRLKTVAGPQGTSRQSVQSWLPEARCLLLSEGEESEVVMYYLNARYATEASTKARRKWFSIRKNTTTTKQQRQLFMRYHHSQPKLVPPQKKKKNYVESQMKKNQNNQKMEE